MEKRQKLIVIFLIVLITLIMSNNDIYANTLSLDASLERYIAHEVSDGSGFFYKDGDTIYFYKVNGNKIVGKDSLDTVLKNIKTAKYQLFVKAAGDAQNPFPNTEITNDKFLRGANLSNKNIYSGYDSIMNRARQNDSSEFEIQLDSNKLKVYLPSVAFRHTEAVERVVDGKVHKFTDVVFVFKNVYYKDYEEYNLTEEQAKEYQFEYNVNYYTKEALIEIVKAVQEGIVAGSIETGFNVGSVYSEEQLPLNDIMEEVIEDGGKFFKFRDNARIKAGLDYFYSPIFGKMFVHDGIPKSAEEWNKKAHTLDISKGYIDIDGGYKDFVSPTSEEREGIFEVSQNLEFSNGVEEYIDGVSSKKPKKLVTYNLTIGLPNSFVRIVGEGNYQFADQGLYLLEDLKMSVWNDTIYDFSGEKKEKVCTNRDIDLQRDYLVLYNQLVDGEPIGVVIPLKYSEVVVDTRAKSSGGTLTQEGIEGDITDTEGSITHESGVVSSNKLYLTGRTIVLDNSYSRRLNIDEENRDIMAVVTKIHGSLGISARKFAFPFGTQPIMETMLEEDNHRVIENNEEGMSFLINFLWDKDSDDSSLQGFVIVRNNMYIQDGGLIDWLRSQEAQAMSNVKATELEGLIRGVFTGNELTFFDWMRIKDISSELNHYKNTMLYRIINIFLIIVGTFFIVFGIIIIFAYWFDVFNTFTEFSILYYISFRSMYPVGSADVIPYMDSNRKYVTFKDIMIRAAIYWIIGALLFENALVLEIILKVYMYISTTMGGL